MFTIIYFKLNHFAECSLHLSCETPFVLDRMNENFRYSDISVKTFDKFADAEKARKEFRYRHANSHS